MTETGRSFLRRLLIAGYDDLKRRLTRRLGSVDLAAEALHETWLRLDAGAAELGTLHRPQSYLYRMALNVAADRRRAEQRWVSQAELEALQRADDDLLDQERLLAARAEILDLERALAELPPRRRAVFVAALVEEQAYRAIAARFGMSLRSVEREVSLALAHCSARLEKKPSKQAGRPPREASSDERGAAAAPGE